MIPALPTIAKSGFVLRSGQGDIASALIDYCLTRIDRLDARVHAWVHVDHEGARKEAKRLGHLLEQGKILGPLHGIPIGIKDIIDVAGWPTRAGSKLRENYIAAVDAPVVAKLRQGGAVILGKTVTTEFACFDPPPTLNPWNLGHTPGGSSSGSAAAVALEMCMAAIGSQTGGSIVRPAAYCGVAGFKPTYGSVSSEGVVPISECLDHVGPIARCVEDLYRVFCVINESPRQQMAAFTRHANVPPRLAVFKGFFRDHSDDGVWNAFEKAMEVIREANGPVETLPLPPSFSFVHVMHRHIMAFDAARYHRRNYVAHRDDFGPNVSSLIEEGLSTSREKYREASVVRELFRAELSDLLAPETFVLLPATNTTAPAGLETTGNPIFNSPWSFAGNPSVTIPCGLAPNGMPVGLQVIGPPFSDVKLLNTALMIERQLRFRERPTLLQEELSGYELPVNTPISDWVQLFFDQSDVGDERGDELDERPRE